MKKLIPLLDRVLIQRAEALTKTAGGIVIPEKAQGKVLRGTVIAVGPGARNQVKSNQQAHEYSHSIKSILGRSEHPDGRESRRSSSPAGVRRHQSGARGSEGVSLVPRNRHPRQS